MYKPQDCLPMQKLKAWLKLTADYDYWSARAWNFDEQKLLSVVLGILSMLAGLTHFFMRIIPVINKLSCKIKFLYIIKMLTKIKNYFITS